MEADLVLEKGCGEKNPVNPHSSSGSKVVLILLTDVVAVHIRFFAIYFQEKGL